MKRIAAPFAARREPVRPLQNLRPREDAPFESDCRKARGSSPNDERRRPPWPSGQPRAAPGKVAAPQGRQDAPVLSLLAAGLFEQVRRLRDSPLGQQEKYRQSLESSWPRGPTARMIPPSRCTSFPGRVIEICSVPRVTPDSSTARNRAATAARPIQWAEPSSEMAKPQPPARAVLPFTSRPKAIDPVPAMTIRPGPSPSADCSAICISPTTSISPGTTSATILRTTVAISSRPAPAAPTQVRCSCRESILASAHASRIASCNASRASSSPTRVILLGPDTAVARIDDSSPTTHAVLLPPPSTPR